MADKKISQLTAATLPLAGTEVLPIVQSNSTVKIASNDLTVKNVRSNSTTGLLQIAGPAASATRVMTTPDANFTVARADAAQTLTGNQTITNGNLVMSSGYGVDFSATGQLSGMTSELLNDYEEGTHQITATPSTSGSITLKSGLDILQYTKVGRSVTITTYFEVASVSSPVGVAVRMSLPFAVPDAFSYIFCSVGQSNSSSLVPVSTYKNLTFVGIEVNASTVATNTYFIVGFSYNV